VVWVAWRAYVKTGSAFGTPPHYQFSNISTFGKCHFRAFSSARALTLGDCETEIFAVGAIQKYACAHYSRLQHIFAPIHPCFFQIKFFQAIPQPRRANLLGLKNDLYVRTTAP
jgi:hypothetical protein